MTSHASASVQMSVSGQCHRASVSQNSAAAVGKPMYHCLKRTQTGEKTCGRPRCPGMTWALTAVLPSRAGFSPFVHKLATLQKIHLGFRSHHHVVYNMYEYVQYLARLQRQTGLHIEGKKAAHRDPRRLEGLYGSRWLPDQATSGPSPARARPEAATVRYTSSSNTHEEPSSSHRRRARQGTSPRRAAELARAYRVLKPPTTGLHDSSSLSCSITTLLKTLLVRYSSPPTS